MRRAVSVLYYIAHNYDIDLPKILPEDSECLSFTWEDGFIKRYLSLTDVDADLTLFNWKQDTSYLETLCEDGELNLDHIARALKLVIDPVSNTSGWHVKERHSV